MKKFDFRPAPFWFINHLLKEDEICEQLDLIKKAGVSGVFIHPRAGSYYQTYGSKEWFEMFAYITEQAARRNLKIWIYDEDPYPSGAAGGRVFFENPAFAARRMRLIKVEPQNGVAEAVLGPNEVLSAVALKLQDGEVADQIDLSESLGTVRHKFFKSEWKSPYYCDMMGKIVFDHVRAETYFPQMAIKTQVPEGYTVFIVIAELYYSDDKYGVKPDNLNEECTEAFINLTHKKYARYVGNRFGNEILGVFTDEPSPGAFLPYTKKLFRKFQTRYGYSLRKNLFRLFMGADEFSQQIRLDYYLLVNDLVTKNFYGKLHRWCRKNGLLLTGHIISEEDLIAQASLGENVYRSVKYFDIPGFDITGNNIGDNDHFALCVGGKIVTSAARQAGKKIVMSELFSNSPFNYDLAGMNRLTYFMFALGIQFLVPHGFHYSIDGYRKFDAGTSLFFQFSEFDRMPEFCTMAAKFGEILSEGRHVCNTCIVLPMRELYKWVSADQSRAQALFGKIISAARYLTNHYIEYDFIDDTEFLNDPVVNGKIRVGKEAYQNIVLFKKLYEGENDKYGALRLIDIEKIQDADLSEACRTDIVANGGDVSRLMVLKRSVGGKALYYLFNNGSGQIDFTLCCGVSHIKMIVPYRGEYCAAAGKDGVRIVLNGYDCIIAVETEHPFTPEFEPPRFSGEITEYAWMKTPEWDYKLPAENAVFIQKYNIEVIADTKKFTCQNHDYCLIREVYGTKRDYLKGEAAVPVFDILGIHEVELYPVTAVYTAEFFVAEGYNYMLIEGETFAGNCKLYLNGQKLPLEKFEKRKIYDFNNRILNVKDILQAGKNELRVVFENADEFCGIRSLIHLLKNPQSVWQGAGK